MTKLSVIYFFIFIFVIGLYPIPACIFNAPVIKFYTITSTKRTRYDKILTQLFEFLIRVLALECH